MVVKRTVALASILALPVSPSAAPNPCRVACRATRKACFQAASLAFVGARSACAAQARGADRRACRLAARMVRAGARSACRGTFATCAAACPHAATTTTTVPGSHCGDAEAAALAGITAAHDRVRADATPTPDPPLAPLCYSAAIAAAAQSYADGCVFQHDLQRLQRLGLGENLYAAAGNASASAATDAVPAWACEAANYDYASNTCSLNRCALAAGVCGHYTQLVWRDTSRVGCGIAACSSGSPFPGFTNWTLLVCDYQPPGNVQVCYGPDNCILGRPY